MVLSAENLKALSHFCLCSAEELQWKPLHPDAVKFRQITLLLSVPYYGCAAVKEPWIYSRVHMSSRAQSASSHRRSPWQNRWGRSGKSESHCEAVDLSWWEKPLRFRALLIWVRVCRTVLLVSDCQRKRCHYITIWILFQMLLLSVAVSSLILLPLLCTDNTCEEMLAQVQCNCSVK